VSFYDQAVIDARERELQQRQKDEKKEKKDRGEKAGPEGGPKFKIETSSDTVPGSGFGAHRSGAGFGTGLRSDRHGTERAVRPRPRPDSHRVSTFIVTVPVKDYF
jgi:hypothetical protein